jgi:hypothetical protein
MFINHIIMKDIFTFVHKFNLKEPSPFDWLVLTSSNWIASIGKAMNRAVLIVSDRWREKTQKAKM